MVRSYALEHSRIRECVEREKRRREEVEERRKLRLARLGSLLEGVSGWEPSRVEALLKDVTAKALLKPQDVPKWKAALIERARSLLAALDRPDGDAEALRKAFVSYAGRRDLARWAAEAAETGWKLFAGSEIRRELDARKRREQAEAARAAALATEREAVKALRFRLAEMGVQEPLTLERFQKLLRMLPEKAAQGLKLRFKYDLFGFGKGEPAWASEPPDPEVLAAQRRAVPDAVLLCAWNDRWVTAATAAAELGVSVGRIRALMPCLETVEVDNPHYSSTAPMRLIRLSSLLDWAEAHRDEVERWAEASRKAKEAWRRAFDRKVWELRGMPERIRAVSDSPAPLVCFWLTLLNRAAKTGRPELYRMKDDALRALVRAGVPFELGYIEGGDKEEKVWLCGTCYESAREMGMHPLEYIEVVGPCKDCDVEPEEPNYYDLYELVFSFPGIGKFCYHVPYDVGREWLPGPEKISDEAWRLRGEEEGFAFGRPLNKVEREAFSVDEIKEGLLAALGELVAWTEGRRGPCSATRLVAPAF